MTEVINPVTEEAEVGRREEELPALKEDGGGPANKPRGMYDKLSSTTLPPCIDIFCFSGVTMAPFSRREILDGSILASFRGDFLVAIRSRDGFCLFWAPLPPRGPRGLGAAGQPPPMGHRAARAH